MTFDQSKFIAAFKAETQEHLQVLSRGLLALERNPHDVTPLPELMRSAHTIKGSASLMGFSKIADLAHRMENWLEEALRQKRELASHHFDLLLEAVDAIEALLEGRITWKSKTVEAPDTEELCKRMDLAGDGRDDGNKEAASPAENPSAISFRDQAPAERPPNATEENVRVDARKLNTLMHIAGEFVTLKMHFGEWARNIAAVTGALSSVDDGMLQLLTELHGIDERLQVLTGNLRDEVVNLRLVPVAGLFRLFPRAMRDLALEKGKELEFELTGEEAMLDKGLIEKLKDPIMHILRNAVDHGLETPAEREALGKPRAGRVRLSASRKGSNIVIEVSDDGAGVDTAQVKRKAVAKGILSQEKADTLDPDQLTQILFTRGFSTRDVVSETSGRGVGLDVVRENVLRLKGVIAIETKQGAGTQFRIQLPMTLAVSNSLMVAAGNEQFAIPIEAVAETVRIAPEDIRSVESKEAIMVRGAILPLVRLSELFGLSRKGIHEPRYSSVVIVQAADKKLALLVDKTLGCQEIVSQALSAPLQNLPHLAGGTILGNGRAVLILDVPSIVESGEGGDIDRPGPASSRTVHGRKRKTILLAEDTMSTAMYEKNILESVGYGVVLARDGKEALELASHEHYDLIITDVLMPGMDGFELTARLKKDPSYKHTPVIIVTTRGGAADKRRGMEAGADAYLLKSDFTAEALLETLERLLG